jgi:hypothetical protein
VKARLALALAWLIIGGAMGTVLLALHRYQVAAAEPVRGDHYDNGGRK